MRTCLKNDLQLIGGIMTGNVDQSKTVILKKYLACSNELLTDDRFCRLCGVNQYDLGEIQKNLYLNWQSSPEIAPSFASQSLEPKGADAIQAHSQEKAFDEDEARHSQSHLAFVTHVLKEQTSHHKVSAPLIQAMTDSMKPTVQFSCGLVLQKIFLALISIPVWIMIILLSPFDAYATSKDVLSHITCKEPSGIAHN
jgi:hypothetical protein